MLPTIVPDLEFVVICHLNHIFFRAGYNSLAPLVCSVTEDGKLNIGVPKMWLHIANGNQFRWGVLRCSPPKKQTLSKHHTNKTTRGYWQSPIQSNNQSLKQSHKHANTLIKTDAQTNQLGAWNVCCLLVVSVPLIGLGEGLLALATFACLFVKFAFVVLTLKSRMHFWYPPGQPHCGSQGEGQVKGQHSGCTW
jgi:hypothetical protein